MNASDSDGKSFGVYVHVPFCRAPRCAYCDFYSTPVSGSGIDSWLEAVKAECSEAHRERFDDCWTVSSIFLGGGTPSLLAPEMISGLLETILHCWSVAPEAEISVECNPEDIDSHWVAACLDAGVNRLSVGVQSFNSEYLAAIGRCHQPGRAARALTVAREAGFDRVSADLILGGPGSSEGIILESVERALELGVEHLSVYGYHLDPPASGYGCAGFNPVDDDAWAGQYLAVCNLLEQHGWRHYEISNWAQTDSALCSHNMIYWQRQPYLGLGPSAHSFGPGQVRSANAADLERWLAAAGSGEFSAVREVEKLDEDTLACERVMLGLRLDDGVPLALLEQLHGARAAVELENLVRKGLVLAQDGRVRLNDSGFLLFDSIVGHLLPSV